MKDSGYFKKSALFWRKNKKKKSLLSQPRDSLHCITSSPGSWSGQRMYAETIPDHWSYETSCARRVTLLRSSQTNYFCHLNSLRNLKWTCTFLNFLYYIVGLSYHELLNNCCVSHIHKMITSPIPGVICLTGAHSDLIHPCL